MVVVLATPDEKKSVLPLGNVLADKMALGVIIRTFGSYRSKNTAVIPDLCFVNGCATQ